jgi:hypothetical protein
VEATDSSAMVLPARSARCSRAVAIMSAVSPRPVPWAARPASSTQNGPGTTVARPPATTAASVPTTVARRRGPSPRRPSSGMATAPVSRVIVSVHCAAASETW